jgi:hypothetical protein
MADIATYIVQDGHCYLLLEPDQYGRETANLKLIISLARGKLGELKRRQAQVNEETHEYARLQDEINDHEMLISDAEDRFELFLRIPSSVWS